jgi:hypothetical protein
MVPSGSPPTKFGVCVTACNRHQALFTKTPDTLWEPDPIVVKRIVFLFFRSHLSVSPPRLSSLRATWSKKRNSTQEGGSARAASSRRAVYEFRSVRTCGPTARPAPRARHTRLCTRWHRPVQRKRRRTPADRRLGCTHRQMPSPTAKAWSETCSSARAGSEGKHAHTPHANRCGAPAPTHG